MTRTGNNELCWIKLEILLKSSSRCGLETSEKFQWWIQDNGHDYQQILVTDNLKNIVNTVKILLIKDRDHMWFYFLLDILLNISIRSGVIYHTLWRNMRFILIGQEKWQLKSQDNKELMLQREIKTKLSFSLRE